MTIVPATCSDLAANFHEITVFSHRVKIVANNVYGITLRDSRQVYHQISGLGYCQLLKREPCKSGTSHRLANFFISRYAISGAGRPEAPKINQRPDGWIESSAGQVMYLTAKRQHFHQLPRDLNVALTAVQEGQLRVRNVG